MQNNSYRYSNWRVIGRFLMQHVPIVAFLTLSIVGMLTVYWYFSPAFGNTEAVVAATQDERMVLAPLAEDGQPIPVSQRFRQSPPPIRVGIIAGHLDSDSGAVCDDGLKEVDINLNIAEKVVAILTAQGVRSEILSEFDERLTNYSATALISIHADSCVYYNELATGFKIAGSRAPGSARLNACMREAYIANTGMTFHTDTITAHMTDYHAFRKVAANTPAIILETGFMNLDREMLTTNVDVPVAGVASGILCFLGKGAS